VPPPHDPDVLEVHGLFFVYDEDDDEVWMWEEKGQVWSVLPMRPPYLTVVQDKLTLIDPKTRKPKCVCDLFVVVNLGCKCGGV
jgi:hypothetical protein